MDTNYPTVDEPATKEYVLSVFRDVHRQEFASTAAAGDAFEDLSFDTSIDDWRFSWDYDLETTSEVGRRLNVWWNFYCSEAEWRRVLKPASKKCLGDVCDLIASHAVRQRIRPARMLGRECIPAGAFLTVRSLLAEAGADGENITPSTRLDPYTRRFTSVFLGPIAALAPGKLPALKIHRPIQDWLLGTMLGTWLVYIIAWIAGFPFVAATAAILLIFSYAATWIVAYCVPPKKAEFGPLETFRNLALVLAEQDAEH